METDEPDAESSDSSAADVKAFIQAEVERAVGEEFSHMYAMIMSLNSWAAPLQNFRAQSQREKSPGPDPGTHQYRCHPATPYRRGRRGGSQVRFFPYSSGHVHCLGGSGTVGVGLREISYGPS